MEAQSQQAGKAFRRLSFAAAVLGGFLLFAGASGAEAHDRHRCLRRIDRAEWKLERAIARHGFYSRHAFHRRHELREARARCFHERGRYGAYYGYRHGDHYRYRDY